MHSQIWSTLEQMQGDIAAEIRVMLGESQYPASLFDEEQRKRRIEAMKKCAEEATSDSDRHEAWMKMHIEAGWVHGETFDPAAKTHPNLLPWDQLPETTRSKAKIFDIVSKAAQSLVKAYEATLCDGYKSDTEDSPASNDRQDFMRTLKQHAEIQSIQQVDRVMQQTDRAMAMMGALSAGHMTAINSLSDAIVEKIRAMTPEQYLELCRIQGGFTS